MAEVSTYHLPAHDPPIVEITTNLSSGKDSISKITYSRLQKLKYQSETLEYHIDFTPGVSIRTIL